MFVPSNPNETTLTASWQRFCYAAEVRDLCKKREFTNTWQLSSWHVPEDFERFVRYLRTGGQKTAKRLQVGQKNSKTDLRFYNLWHTRLRLIHRYRTTGHTTRLKRTFNQVTKAAADYASKQAAEKLWNLCDAFSGFTNLSKISPVVHLKQGKINTRIAAQNAVLHLQKTDEELAFIAGAAFCPHSWHSAGWSL